MTYDLIILRNTQIIGTKFNRCAQQASKQTWPTMGAQDLNQIIRINRCSYLFAHFKSKQQGFHFNCVDGFHSNVYSVSVQIRFIQMMCRWKWENPILILTSAHLRNIRCALHYLSVLLFRFTTHIVGDYRHSICCVNSWLNTHTLCTIYVLIGGTCVCI